MKPQDIKRVAGLAIAHGLKILDHYLPGGQREGKEYKALNPHREDRNTGSLSVEIATGKGGDFATGEKWGDYVGLVAFVNQCKAGEAAKSLAAFLGIDTNTARVVQASAPKETARPPAAALEYAYPKDRPPPLAHPKRGKPDQRYRYTDERGEVVCEVCRWDAKGEEGKYFSPLIWTGAGYRWQAPAPPRPIFNRHLFAARPDAPALLVEGEKSAVAAAGLLPEHIPTTAMNGAQSVDKADYRPCAGRPVIVWPDADSPGAQAAQKAAKRLAATGAASVQFLNVDLLAKYRVGSSGGLVSRAGPLPSGWDAADAVAEGWNAQTFAEFLQMDGALLDALPDGSVEEPPAASDVTQEPGEDDENYLLEHDGLYFLEKTKVDDKWRSSKRCICGPLKVLALSSYTGGDGYGPLIEFTDRDGRKRAEVIPYKLFLGQGLDGIKLLADLGLYIAPNDKALGWLRRHIVGAKPLGRAVRVTTTGWHGRHFAFPDGTVGDGDKVLLFDGSRRTTRAYATAGTLQQWQTNIALQATGNPMLTLALSLSFAGPLLKPLGEAGSALHLVGDSSTGKSTALAAAGSTWGPTDEQVRSWRSTSNALEGTCALSNHALLVLDEFRELDPKDATAVTYMLSNGRGKQRMSHAGGLRDAVEWAIVILSSGELGLADHLASAGQKTYAGQQVRFIELDTDAGAGHGMWNNVHGMIEGGKGFSDVLKKAAAKYYGTAGRAFVAQCVKNYDMLAPTWRNYQHEFSRNYKPANAGGQVLRVMTTFALIGFAGKLATRWEIVPWQPDDATAAAGEMFLKWLRDRPTTGNSEEHQILAHVRALMERSWKSRFDDWHRIETEASGDTLGDLSRAPTVLEPLGFRRKDELGGFRFYIFRRRFEDEFAHKAGFKPRRVAAILRDKGILLTDNNESTTKRELLPNGDPRSYCLIGNHLWEHGDAL